MKEIGIATTNGKDNLCKIEYNFDTGVLTNLMAKHEKTLSLDEYNRMKENTIKRFKERGYSLTFEVTQ